MSSRETDQMRAACKFFGIDPDHNPLDRMDMTGLVLPWTWSAQNVTVECLVPVEPYAGYKGQWLIYGQVRPYYCDRGRFHFNVNGVGVTGPDFQEGFPRYYFSLQRALEEMEDWVKIRKEVRWPTIDKMLGVPDQD